MIAHYAWAKNGMAYPTADKKADVTDIFHVSIGMFVERQTFKIHFSLELKPQFT